jgi:hypothetical protein
MAHAPPCSFALGIDPWERQPKEADEAWRAFAHYRDALDDSGDPLRSIGATSRALDEHLTQCKRWSSRWRWRDRCVAYDRHLDGIATKAKEKAIKVMVGRHAALANAGLGVLQEPIKELISRIERKAIDLKALSDDALIKLVRQSASAIRDLVGVERVARGVPETVLGGVVGSPTNFAAMVAQLFEVSAGGGGDAPENALAALLAKPPEKPEESGSQTPA